MSGLRLRLANKLNLKNSPKKYQMRVLKNKFKIDVLGKI